jgi:hypothetical protein
MYLSIYMKGDYEEFHALRRHENKPNSNPFLEAIGVYSCEFVVNLKKQTQSKHALSAVEWANF